MRKVPVDLIGKLNKAAENQKPLIFNLFENVPKKVIEYNDLSYDKGHDVPEGYYVARLLSVKYHNSMYYKIQLEILKDAQCKTSDVPRQVIKGYVFRPLARRDFEDCFGVYKKFSDCVGRVGIIRLSHSGWVDCQDSKCYAEEQNIDLSAF